MSSEDGPHFCRHLCRARPSKFAWPSVEPGGQAEIKILQVANEMAFLGRELWGHFMGAAFRGQVSEDTQCSQVI